MKKKGFTLIELLAVIIVLAIIALIVMPIIFNVIENAKVKSLENSAYGVVDAVRLQYMENLMNSDNGEVQLSGSVTTLTLSGEHPTGGTWKIDNEATSEDVGIKISGVTFASMEGYVCDSEEVDGKLTGEVVCLKDNIAFTVASDAINGNGWAKEDINVKVTAEGVTNLKYCLSDKECTPNQTLTNSGVDITENGSTYLCVQGDNSKVRCNAYNLDKNAPTLTVEEGTHEIIKGDNVDLTNYFTVTYGISGEKSLSCSPSTTSTLAVGNYTIPCRATGLNGLTTTESVKIKVLAEYVDESGANVPKLFTNMIPVTYNETTSKWTYASRAEEWYDYDAKQWANAVILNANPSKTYTIGDDIEMSDIAQMYVWIPRYKYTIFNGNNGIVATPKLINVEFEKGTATTGTVKCYDSIKKSGTSSEVCTDSTNGSIKNGTSTYTHPAFCLGTKNSSGNCSGRNLTGIWVGKFEISSGNGNITVLPNKNPVVTYTQGSFYDIINEISTKLNIKYGNSYADSHMMKNMEWGAVAYLKQSEYGLGTTDIAVNNYYADGKTMTGCGSAVGTTATTTTCATYDTTNGKKASTTGNIYGVYDMSGGTYEYVMGYVRPSSGSLAVGTATAKYYDLYSHNTTGDTYGRGKLGDATKETLRAFGSDRVNGWYSDFSIFPYYGSSLSSSYPWFVRGGSYSNGTNPGIFAFINDNGFNKEGRNISTRSVITQP